MRLKRKRTSSGGSKTRSRTRMQTIPTTATAETPLVIQIRYIKGKPVESWVSHWPADSLAELRGAIDATHPSQVDPSFPDTCCIEFRFDPITKAVTGKQIETVQTEFVPQHSPINAGELQ